MVKRLGHEVARMGAADESAQPAYFLLVGIVGRPLANDDARRIVDEVAEQPVEAGAGIGGILPNESRVRTVVMAQHPVVHEHEFVHFGNALALEQLRIDVPHLPAGHVRTRVLLLLLERVHDGSCFGRRAQCTASRMAQANDQHVAIVGLDDVGDRLRGNAPCRCAGGRGGRSVIPGLVGSRLGRASAQSPHACHPKCTHPGAFQKTSTRKRTHMHIPSFHRGPHRVHDECAAHPVRYDWTV